MRCRVKSYTPRSGATVVEMAVILSVFILILFGIVEYCRIIWFQQVMINAAREGSRYAVVHTQDPTVIADTKGKVHTAMAGTENQTTDFDILVFKADANGNNVGTPDQAKFGETIMVEVECDYRPLLPSLLLMDNTIRLKAKAPMNCEAN